MKKIQCEICKRSVALTSDALAAAAMDQPAEMICPCGSRIEAVYCDNKLLTANAPRMIRFKAAEPIKIENSPRLEAK